MPAPGRRARTEPAESVPKPPPKVHALLATAVILTLLALGVRADGASHDLGDSQKRRNDTSKVLAYHTNTKQTSEQPEAPSKTYQLVSTSESHEKQKKPEEFQVDNEVPSSDLPAATKQYDFPLIRPYGPIITAFPSRPPSAGWPSVEILSHHRDPPFVTSKPNQHLMGNPMVSTVVVQDMSQSASPRPPISMDPSDGISSVDNVHHLSSTTFPFTDVKVVSKPLHGKRPVQSSKPDPNFTDKVEETDLNDDDSLNELLLDDDFDTQENPPHLDMGGIVENALKDVFKDKKVLKASKETLQSDNELPTGPWSCPPLTCCTRATRKSLRKCSSVVNCVQGRPAQCAPLSERLPTPQALALALTQPAANATDSKADVRDGEPRFKKKKKLIKKKKKFLKQFMLPLLIAYKLLFLMIVPMMVNGMMMMMSSSGMAGFFFALIGASVAMVRVYTGGMRITHPPTPAPNKVVKVIKYVQTPPPAQTTTPTPTPAPTLPTTIIHHQPLLEEHYPSYHAPPPPPPPPPAYGSYFPPHPYMTRYYDRSGAYEGGRKKRRRKYSVPYDNSDFDGTFANFSQNDYWLVE